MRRLARREHVLLMVALAVAAGTVFHFLRVRPAFARIASLDLETSRYEDRLKEVSWPRSVEDADRIEERCAALRRDLETARAELRRLESRFVSGRDGGAADGLRLAISGLADRNGVRIRENVPCPASSLRAFAGDARRVEPRLADASRFVRFLTLEEPYAFRARDVTIHARTADLRGFLHDLGGLEHQVLVLRFDIEVDPRTWMLHARLVLVF